MRLDSHSPTVSHCQSVDPSSASRPKMVVISQNRKLVWHVNSVSVPLNRKALGNISPANYTHQL